MVSLLLVQSLNIPIISIPTLEATAYNMNFTEKLICPIMDARRHQVYTGIFRCKETTLEAVMPSNAMALEDLLSELNKLGEEFDRYKIRWDRLAKSIQTVNKEVEDVQITSDKISKKFNKISGVEIEKISTEQK